MNGMQFEYASFTARDVEIFPEQRSVLVVRVVLTR